MTQQEKMSNLKQRLEEFMGRLDNLDPEQTSVEDIDRLISMLESLERSMDE
ncbi:SE1561 family protein [Halobacillus kuroshimensis]|nr:SE1561 family protein [Halobacillus kuroshimensis]